jgi:LEA14-like dessication related protein
MAAVRAGLLRRGSGAWQGRKRMVRGTSVTALRSAIYGGARAGRTGALVACALLIAACAGLSLKPLPPKVEFAAVRVQGLAGGDLRLAVKLDVDNPNPFALDIARIDAEINVNGTQLAVATLPAPVSVAASATTGVELELRSRLEQLARVLERADGSGRMPYALTGTVVLGDGTRLPFARRGELPVGDWLQGRRR